MGMLDVVLPVDCVGCSRRGASVCDRCLHEMEPGGWVEGVSMPVVAAVAYRGVARELVVALKYRRRRDALGWMADAVASTVVWAGLTPAAVTWVPASRAGRRSRGFDQGRLLASEVGRRLGLPVARLLERTGSGRQVGLDRQGRYAEAGRIAATSAAPGADADVLVVDDVVTTGASMASARAALHSAGVRQVVGAAFAHKP